MATDRKTDRQKELCQPKRNQYPTFVITDTSPTHCIGWDCYSFTPSCLNKPHILFLIDEFIDFAANQAVLTPRSLPGPLLSLPFLPPAGLPLPGLVAGPAEGGNGHWRQRRVSVAARSELRAAARKARGWTLTAAGQTSHNKRETCCSGFWGQTQA